MKFNSSYRKLLTYPSSSKNTPYFITNTTNTIYLSTENILYKALLPNISNLIYIKSFEYPIIKIFYLESHNIIAILTRQYLYLINEKNNRILYRLFIKDKYKSDTNIFNILENETHVYFLLGLKNTISILDIPKDIKNNMIYNGRKLNIVNKINDSDKLKKIIPLDKEEFYYITKNNTLKLYNILKNKCKTISIFNSNVIEIYLDTKYFKDCLIIILESGNILKLDTKTKQRIIIQKLHEKILKSNFPIILTTKSLHLLDIKNKKILDVENNEQLFKSTKIDLLDDDINQNEVYDIANITLYKNYFFIFKNSSINIYDIHKNFIKIDVLNYTQINSFITSNDLTITSYENNINFYKNLQLMKLLEFEEHIDFLASNKHFVLCCNKIGKVYLVDIDKYKIIRNFDINSEKHTVQTNNLNENYKNLNNKIKKVKMSDDIIILLTYDDITFVYDFNSSIPNLMIPPLVTSNLLNVEIYKQYIFYLYDNCIIKYDIFKGNYRENGDIKNCINFIVSENYIVISSINEINVLDHNFTLEKIIQYKQKNRHRGQLYVNKASYPTNLALNSTERLLVVGGESNYVKIYNINNKIELQKIRISDNKLLENYKEKLGNEKNLSDKEFNPYNIIKIKELMFNDKDEIIIRTPHELSIYSNEVDNATLNPIEYNGEINITNYEKNIMQGKYDEAFLIAIKLQDKNLIQNILNKLNTNSMKEMVKKLDENDLKVLRNSVHDYENPKIYDIIEILCKRKVDNLSYYRRMLWEDYLKVRKENLKRKYLK